MGILAWIIFGAIAGWVASLIMNTDREQGAVANVIIGIVGAIIGGLIARALGGSGVSGFNLGSLLVAILGAVVLLGVYKMVAHRT
jgi:uncharacterized membrane protein YeaQ/YmgE (transglycosylase-associated protein family)